MESGFKFLLILFKLMFRLSSKIESFVMKHFFKLKIFNKRFKNSHESYKYILVIKPNFVFTRN